VAVYHEGTGDTHLFEQAAYVLLLSLQGTQSLSVNEFMCQLDERHTSSASRLSEDYYLHMLDELSKLHIVEPMQ